MPANDFRSIYMPYCLQRQQDGTYVVLNRDYKPVGFNTTEFVDYSSFPVAASLRGLGPATAAKLSFSGSDDTDRIYLYDDGCAPTSSAEDMAAYLSRLDTLASLRVNA